ncbi:MAG: hypothetical protein KJ601_01515 [Nanoarchaeota archaeon]|nr:hypothetical protein [Nanoarchaeota archaeon]MBU1705010.1 hypothetical protein [Nanoarchaeota archaeon]
MGSTYFSNRVRLIVQRAERARGQIDRPKSFRSEEAAKAYAEKKGIKKYSLRNLKNEPNKKIIIEKA